MPLYVLQSWTNSTVYFYFFSIKPSNWNNGKNSRLIWTEKKTFLWDYNCIIILCQLILKLIRCPCSYCPGTAVMCRFSAACTCCSASPWPHPEIFKCGEAIHANVATAHFPKTCCSLSNITSNRFPGKTLRTPTWPLPLRPFLPTTSLILCHADGCNCQTVLLVDNSHMWRVWARWEGEDSGWGGLECGPLILWATGSSLLIIACWSQCSYSW